ncbi:hypothetical protein ACF3OE_06460 [Capnocytophaga canis]|uniref:hypothetical protein n=1 Tax=Capnocytophaga canis TaxID=1848903 RepID=UPI00370CFD61
MENWQDLYVELAQRISEKMPEIKWVDLWHNQVGFLADEHPFSTPAVFIAFRSNQTQDVGELMQIVDLQVDFYLYYETFLDTFVGAYNQSGALEFTKSLDALFGIFHGSTGENYSSMRRLGFAPVDTGTAGNLYQVTFECKLQDTSAMKYYEPTDVKVKVSNENTDFFIA